MKKILFFLSIILGAGCNTKQIVQKSINLSSSNSSSSTYQLTKEQVKNGYDQCGVQFKDGNFSLSWDRYKELEDKMLNINKTIECDAASHFLDNEEIIFADLDNDSLVEALVSARVIIASSGGTLYVFKNIEGVARVVDRITFGKGNGKIISVDKDIIKVEYEDPTALNISKATYKFINGHLVKQ